MSRNPGNLPHILEVDGKEVGISKNEAARRIRVHVLTISRWVQAGYIREVRKEGSTIFVDVQDVELVRQVYEQDRGKGSRVLQIVFGSPGFRLLRDIDFPADRDSRYVELVQKTGFPYLVIERVLEAAVEIGIVGLREHHPIVSLRSNFSKTSREDLVASIEEAAEKTGVPVEDILTVQAIEKEFGVYARKVRRWANTTSLSGEPYLLPLPVRLKHAGAGGGQLLFAREEVERIIANPPKWGGSRKK